MGKTYRRDINGQRINESTCEKIFNKYKTDKYETKKFNMKKQEIKYKYYD